MKRNKKVFFLVLSLVIIILLITIIYLAFAKDKIYTLKTPSNESQPDFTDVKILSYTDLNAMNSEDPVQHGYNHSISVKGVCSEFKICNSDDALKALYALQDIITSFDILRTYATDKKMDEYQKELEFLLY